MFFANGVVAASEPITPATANEVATVGSDGNADGVPGTSDEEDSNKASTSQPAEGKPAGELKAQGTTAEEANQGQELDRSKPAPVGQEGSQAGEIREKNQLLQS